MIPLGTERTCERRGGLSAKSALTQSTLTFKFTCNENSIIMLRFSASSTMSSASCSSLSGVVTSPEPLGLR